MRLAEIDLTNVTPLSGAHAHGDCDHDRPLLDALEHGFTSVEADVWYADGEVLVGHHRADTDPSRTLAGLYLEPLAKLVANHGGSVFPGHRGFQLLIDLKHDHPDIYPAVEDALRQFPGLVSSWQDGELTEGALTAVVSGERPRAVMSGRALRHAGYDGRLSDIGSGLHRTFMPLVSDDWTSTFTWTGVGPMPDHERARLHEIVTSAHADGHLVRFWATPDEIGDARTSLWTELRDAGVDYLNTDDLPGLRDFLTEATLAA
ncbi:MAG TPA: hypothetical protein VF053_15485 [Streptosporangiales bacterium]